MWIRGYSIAEVDQTFRAEPELKPRALYYPFCWKSASAVASSLSEIVEKGGFLLPISHPVLLLNEEPQNSYVQNSLSDAAGFGPTPCLLGRISQDLGTARV